MEQCLASLSDAQALRTVSTRWVDCRVRAQNLYLLFAGSWLAWERCRHASASRSMSPGVLLEAHRSPDLARYLLASHPQMTERWKRLEPLLEEFDRTRASLATSGGSPPSSSPSDRKRWTPRRPLRSPSEPSQARPRRAPSTPSWPPSIDAGPPGARRSRSRPPWRTWCPWATAGSSFGSLPLPREPLGWVFPTHGATSLPGPPSSSRPITRGPSPMP